MGFIDSLLGREDQRRKKQLEADNARIEREMAPLRQQANQRLQQQARTGTIPISNVPGFGVRKPDISQRMAFQQAQQGIMNNGSQEPQVRTLPKVILNQGFFNMDAIRNVFDSNSTVDKINRAREGRAVDYRQSELDRGNMRPMENIGQQIVGNTARLVNTVGQAGQTIPLNVRIRTAQATGNMRALEQALKESQSYNTNLSSGRGGLLNAGNFLYSNEKDLGISTAEALKRSTFNTVGTASEVLPYKINVLKGARLAPRIAANAALDAGLGVAESIPRQYMQTGKVDPRMVATDALSNAAMGLIPSVGGQLYRKGIDPVNQVKVKDSLSKATINRVVAKQDAVVNGLEARITKAVTNAGQATGELKQNYLDEARELIRQRNARTKELSGIGAVGKDVRPEPIDPVKKAELDTNTGLKQLSDIRKQYSSDQEFFDKVILENVEAPGKIGEYARHIANRDAREGSIYNKNYLTEILDDELAPINTKLDQAMYQGQKNIDLKRGIQELEKSTGQEGLYRKVLQEMKGMTEAESNDYMMKAMISMRDNGVLAMDYINKQNGYKPKASAKPTPQDALEGKSTKPLKVTSSDSSLATSPELSVSSPRSSGQIATQQTAPANSIQTGIQKPQTSLDNSLANYTTKTKEVKLNTDRLNPNSGYEGLAEMQRRTTEVVDTMSNKEIQSLAKDAGIDTVTHSPEQIKKKIAEQLNVRQDAVRYMNEAEVARKAGNLDLAEQSMMKAAEAGRISRAQGSELGQQLQARRIIANQLDTPQQRIFKLLDNAGINPEAYVKRLANVDFNSPKQVVEAYRDLVPAKAKDWVDVVRYNSMLSSPLTHMVNAMSNSVNVGVVAPLEKTLRGVADAVGGLFGKERKFAAGEGIAYMTGSAKSIKKAANEFLSVMSGKSQLQNLDLNEYSTPLATKGVKGATYKTLSVPMQLLGASDKFFRTLAESGEENSLKLRQKKGIKIKGDIKALAEAEGSYRLYQQDTTLKGQGALLSTVDSMTNAIMQLRNKHQAFKWMFPFVKTPSNILKQGIEFSPLGVANLAGNADKATALTRMAIGTAVFGTAASMIASGDMTWAEPSTADARDRFRAEGKQPYAVRIGGKWVAFNKLPPAFSYPMALTAGIHDAVTNGKITDDTGSRIFEGIAKYGQFLSDQSYAKNIGDALNAFKGDTDKTIQAISNYPQQAIPFRALTGWIARMTDDTERRISSDSSFIDKQVQALMQQYPFLRQKTGTRDYEGQPIPANNPVLNAFSPLKVTDDRGTSALDTIRDQKKVQDKEKDALRESLKTDEKTGKPDVSNSEYKVDSKGNVYANIDGEVKSFDSLELYEKAKAKADKQKTVDDFLNGDEKMKEIDGKIYLKSDDTESGYTTKSKAEFNFDKEMQGVDVEIDKAKANDDYDAWLTNADKKYKALIKKRESYDPDTEFDKVDAVNKQILNLEQEYEKYDGYGGKLKKGKKNGGKTGKGASSISKFNLPASFSLLAQSPSSSGSITNLLKNAKVTYRG